MFDPSVFLELILAGLLAATLVYCVLLERRLRALRGDQKMLGEIVLSLNAGISRAQASISGLRVAAAEAGANLDSNLTAARAMIDELSVLVPAGERIANRMEASRDGAGRAAQPSRVVRANAAVHSENLRAVR